MFPFCVKETYLEDDLFLKINWDLNFLTSLVYTEFLICIKKILMYIVRTDSFHLKLSINTSKLANLS